MTIPSIRDVAAGLTADTTDASAPRAPRRGEAPKALPAAPSFPVAYAQRGLWVMHEQAPASCGIYMIARVRAPVDEQRLRAAADSVVAHHDALRTTVVREGDELRQFAEPDGEVDFRVLTPDAATGIDALEQVRREVRQAFELESGPRLRVVLCSLGPAEHFVAIGVHHFFGDHHSLWMIMAHLSRAYAGDPGPAPEALPWPGNADWALREEAFLASDEGRATRDYWRRALAGCEPPLALPADRDRPEHTDYLSVDYTRPMAPATIAGITALARAIGASFFSVSLAAYVALLHRYTGREDVIVATPVSQRPDPRHASVMGYAVNTIPVRVACPGDRPFVDLVRDVAARLREARSHTRFPLQMLVDYLGREGVPQLPLLNQVEAPARDPRRIATPELPLEAIDYGQTGSVADMVLMVIRDYVTGVSLRWSYAPDLYDAATVARYDEAFAGLLASATARPETPVGALDVVSPAERQKLLVDFNATGIPYRAASFADLVAQRAELLPEACAVESDECALTYGELVARARRLAQHLRARGVGRGDRVASCFDPSPEMAVAFLGILTAGAVYVPVDPTTPAARVAKMLGDVEARMLVTRAAHEQTLPAALPRVLLDAGWLDALEANEVAALETTGPDDPAYVIFTSGSTGEPKGVLLPHRGMANLTEVVRRSFPLPPGARVLQFASPAFDSSIWEFVVALGTGATLCTTQRSRLHGADLARVLRERHISFVTMPPSALAVMPVEPLPELRVILVVGEVCPEGVVAAWKPGRRLVNGYGPTETTVAASWGDVSEGGTRNIGRPIPNVMLYVLDAARRPAPIGVAGEIYIGGPGVALGYVGRPEATRQRFVDNPFSPAASPKLYRTGDRGRVLADGSVEFLGRVDRQVKLRGFRIELEEIEAELCRQPDVRHAAVDVVEVTPGDRRLLAVVAAEASVEASTLRAGLRRALPEYMVPASIAVVDALPLTVNGKVDRRGLAALMRPMTVGPAAPSAPSIPPANAAADHSELETAIARAWCEVLGLERVGFEDRFFDVGGNSLLFAKLQARVEKATGISVPVVTFFDRPTVRSLAAWINERGRASSVEILRPVAHEPVGSNAIAIVGMAARVPGAPDIARFWELLRDGREGLSTLTDEELDAAGVDPALRARPEYVRVKGVLADADRFDAAFFGYSPREAESLDPQHRVFLECAWTALEHAGYAAVGESLRAGVFAGASRATYRPATLDSDSVETFQEGLASSPDFLPTRVSFKLGLRGPSLAVQTACSTSLAAVHLACRSLLARECDVALAGGVSITLPLAGGYLFQRGMIFSPDGHCRAFSADAAGTLPGNGVGVVALKRLADALADGDAIHAVIRGSALNNDGGERIGFTAPSVSGQAEVIRAAQLAAGVRPRDVTYVEAHGTGTELGDPVEVAALTRAFGVPDPAGPHCGLGTVKSNLGHLDAAAGVVALIKTVLCLRHQTLVPTLHAARPNPALGLEASPFWLVNQPGPWELRGRASRVAGVSSFGAGGTNVHVVLEEAPREIPRVHPVGWQLLPLSARTPRALAAMARSLAAQLGSENPVGLADTAYTLQVGRRAFEHRAAVACRSRAEAVERLGELARGVERASNPAADSPDVAFLLPGFGSQREGMARALYEAFPVFRREIDRCIDLARAAGVDLAPALLDAAAPGLSGDDGREQTEIQPAIFAMDYALARLWMALGVRPVAMAGHSTGEYVAACLAGVFTLEDAVRLVVARGRLMDTTPRGGMTAVMAPAPEVEAILPPPLVVAGYNGPATTVVAGPTEALAALEATLDARGVSYRRLHAVHAYHSPSMAAMLPEFEAVLRRVTLRAPAVPFVSNVTGTWITEREATDPAYWTRHIVAPVRFTDSVATLAQRARVMLEVGRGRTLGALAQQHPAVAPRSVLSSLRLAENDEALEVECLFTQAGRLWSLGAALDFEALRGGVRARRVPLPGYAFERQRFWRPRHGAAREVLPAVETSLPEASPTASSQGTDALPSETERALAAIWREVLGVAPTHADDNFFALGGHSLAALRVRLLVAERLGAQLSVHEMASRATLRRLAERVDELRRGVQGGDASLLVDLADGPRDRAPLFLIHPIGGTVFVYQHLARALAGERAVVAIRARGVEPGETPDESIERMAARYVDLVRARAGDGPYHLAGLSFGGIVAQEMARRLHDAGGRVGALALLDSPGPGHWPVNLESDADIAEYLRGMAPDLIGRLFSTSGFDPNLPDAGTYLRLFREQAGAMFRHAPRPYAGRTVFFRALERDAINPPHPEHAWTPFAPAGLTVREVPGNHVSMIDAPHARGLAEQLRGLLVEAEVEV